MDDSVREKKVVAKPNETFEMEEGIRGEYTENSEDWIPLGIQSEDIYDSGNQFFLEIVIQNFFVYFFHNWFQLMWISS